MTKIKQLHSRNVALIAGTLLVLVIGFAAITSADERGERGERKERDNRGPGNGMLSIAAKLNIFAPDLKVRIDNENDVRVQGATVVATSTSGFTATTISPPLMFIVQTDATTKFNIKGVGNGTIANIAIGDTVNFRGVALSGTTTSTWTVKATHVEDKMQHPKPPKAPKGIATTTVHVKATTTAQIQIDALTRVMERLQAMIDQMKIRFGL